MHDGVGIAEAGAERLTEIDVGNLLRGHRIHQPQLIDIDRHGTGGFADAEVVESVKRVGSKLNARADFAQRRGLLQHDAGDALLREADRGGKAADAAARDQHGFRAVRCCHVVPPSRQFELLKSDPASLNQTRRSSICLCMI